MKQFFSFDELPANPVNLHVLVDRVQIEQEHQADETSDCLREHILRVKILWRGLIWKQEGGQCRGEQQRDDGRRYPQPPFSALDLPEIRAESIRPDISKTVRTLLSFLFHNLGVLPILARAVASSFLRAQPFGDFRNRSPARSHPSRALFDPEAAVGCCKLTK